MANERNGHLEILRRRPRRRVDAPPVLLVHGAWHGAWCWDRGFMDRLAAAGHEVAAVSLRGHGGSAGRGSLASRLHGLRGYLDDMAAAAATLDGPPVIVGHSLGGFLAQRHLREGRPAAGAVLMAPAPSTGILPMLLRLALDDPAGVARSLATLRCRPVVGDPARSSRLLFSGRMRPSDALRHHAELGDEPFRAFVELLLPRLPPVPAHVPVLVMAAGADRVITAAETLRTAAAHGTTPSTHAGMGHDMMLEPGWERVADDVAAWVGSLAPTLAAAA